MSMPSTTVAALDDSSAFAATARAARVVAELLRTDLVGLHVREPGSPDAGVLTERAGFPVEVQTGDPVARLLAAIDREDVALAVVGARDDADTRASIGHVALRLARATSTPLLVVPPRSALGQDGAVRRALLPLDGDPHTTAHVQPLVERLAASGVEIVATHVFDQRHLPRCFDHPAHGSEAWRQEFLSRYGGSTRKLQLRRGTTWQAVLDAADEVHADLIVLAWAQRLTPGRGIVVRQAMLNPTVPVLLLPVSATPDAEPRTRRIGVRSWAGRKPLAR